MAKISQVSAKYIIHAYIEIEGVVDRPDVIGAIFGQTEGLLGSDLELRELQRSGRIGRIEVNVDTKTGKSKGEILIPSSLDKAETAIIAAAMEVIERIGPCNAKIKVNKIEDVRVVKRQFVINRAKELLRDLTDSVLPDSQELAEEVTYSVRVMEIQEYGPDKLACGPGIEESDDVIIVEGRADVVTLLKQGFKNVIAMNGTSVPQTIINLSRKKEVTVFTDGDRGGDLIIKELIGVADIDFVTKAPDGKEVEELTKKEIHKALRSKIAIEQAKLELAVRLGGDLGADRSQQRPPFQRGVPQRGIQRPLRGNGGNGGSGVPQPQQSYVRRSRIDDETKGKFKSLLEELVGTRGASILNQNMEVLGKVPLKELDSTLKSLPGVYAIVFDGEVDKEIVETAERARVRCLIGMSSKIRPGSTRVDVLTQEDL